MDALLLVQQLQLLLQVLLDLLEMNGTIKALCDEIKVMVILDIVRTNGNFFVFL